MEEVIKEKKKDREEEGLEEKKKELKEIEQALLAHSSQYSFTMAIRVASVINFSVCLVFVNFYRVLVL